MKKRKPRLWSLGLFRQEQGQAGILMALVLCVVVMCAAAVIHTGELTLARMQAQIAADAGAHTAAAVLADGLNTVAIANVILVGGTLMVPITEGLSAALTRGAHVAQEVAVTTTPALSVALGEAAALISGADLALPTLLPEMNLQKAPLGYLDVSLQEGENKRYVGFMASKNPRDLATKLGGRFVAQWQRAPMLAHGKGVVIWEGMDLDLIKSFIPGYQAALAPNLY